MPVGFFSNNIPLEDRAKRVETAVCEGIGERPGNEDWTASIFEHQNEHRYTITVEGPDGFRWQQDFEKAETSPEFIRAEVQRATRQNP